MALMWPCHDFVSLVYLRKRKKENALSQLFYQIQKACIASCNRKIAKCLQKIYVFIELALKNKIFKFYVLKYLQLFY